MIEKTTKNQFTVAVFGYGGRGKIYADNFQILGIKITAVCDPVQSRRVLAKGSYGCEAYAEEDEFFKEKRADVLIVATLDDMHYEPCVRALRAGYDVILEKPISFKKEECEKIAKVADETGKSVSVCHVLRYAPFYTIAKTLVDSGKFGKIIHVNMTEDVGYYHFAHSYVRGPWRNKKISAPVILAKSCHDMDLFAWFISKKCVRLNSFGNLSFFNGAHAPQGATAHCYDCPREKDCEYSCFKIYLNKEYERLAALARHGRLGATDEEIIASLKQKDNLYGRCVFACDNDVFDHQSVNMLFEDGITGTFTLSAFSQNMERTLKIYCEKGEIYGSSDKKKVKYTFFGDPEEKSVDVVYKNEIYASHGGGDMGLVSDFVENYGKKQMKTDIHLSLQSHYMGFAAEESATNGGKTIVL